MSVPDPENEVWSFCFAGDTLISMADGSQKRIDEIEVGDKVLAFSEDDQNGQGALVPRTVTRLFQKVTDEWLKLSNGVTVTPGHFFLTTDAPTSRFLRYWRSVAGRLFLRTVQLKFWLVSASSFPKKLLINTLTVNIWNIPQQVESRLNHSAPMAGPLTTLIWTTTLSAIAVQGGGQA